MVISRFFVKISSWFWTPCLSTHLHNESPHSSEDGYGDFNLSLDYIKTRTYQTIIMYKSNNANSLLKLTFGKV